MENPLHVTEIVQSNSPDTSLLLERLERADSLLTILSVSAEWIACPEIYAWLMLPISAMDSGVYVVSQKPLPKENVRGLIEEFLWSVGSTATAYGATLPAPDVIDIRHTALTTESTWEPMNEPLFADVGVATRGKLHAVLRVCAAQENGIGISVAAQRVAKIIGPYVDASLLDMKSSCRFSGNQSRCFLSFDDLKERLQHEVSGLRRQPREVGLLRIKLVPRAEITGADVLEKAYRSVRALISSAVRDDDVVGALDEGDIGVFMPNTGPRRALIAAMRLSDALSENPTVATTLRYYVGVSGWAITGSDVEGLLLETELAAAQAQYATTGAVQLFM
jgi:GGDEF domain-containing protein